MPDFSKQIITETSIPGLYVIERPVYSDERGYFREVFRLNDLEEKIGEKFNVVQANHSYSLPRVIRALHVENWNKLVYPVTGKMFAALVDVRTDSKTFGKVEEFTFDDDRRRALFISKGIANSICVVGGEPVHYIYMVDSYYKGDDTSAIAWDDPDIGIKWPVADPIVSERDRQNPKLRDLYPEKFTSGG